jgi:hypothetical protein
MQMLALERLALKCGPLWPCPPRLRRAPGVSGVGMPRVGAAEMNAASSTASAVVASSAQTLVLVCLLLALAGTRLPCRAQIETRQRVRSHPAGAPKGKK